MPDGKTIARCVNKRNIPYTDIDDPYCKPVCWEHAADEMNLKIEDGWLMIKINHDSGATEGDPGFTIAACPGTVGQYTDFKKLARTKGGAYVEDPHGDDIVLLNELHCRPCEQSLSLIHI